MVEIQACESVHVQNEQMFEQNYIWFLQCLLCDQCDSDSVTQ